MTPVQRFQWPLAQGVAAVDVPCAGPTDALALAHALGDVLPTLCALESWLDIDLPCPEPDLSLESTPAAVADPNAVPALTRTHIPCLAHGLALPFADSSSLRGGRLLLPWAALKPGRPVPAGLPVQWPQWPARLCLQLLPAWRLDPSAVVPGAVLLLPAGFASAWPVLLQAMGSGSGSGSGSGVPPAGWQAPAIWLPHAGTLSFPGGPVRRAGLAAAPEEGSVWLTAPLQADLRAWFGGCPGAGAAVVGRAELRWGPQVAAQGRLLPCGAGWGLRIEQVLHPAHATAAAAWT